VRYTQLLASPGTAELYVMRVIRKSVLLVVS
jgi:hypothetical protein